MIAIPTAKLIEAIAADFVSKTSDFKGNQTIVKRSIHIRATNKAEHVEDIRFNALNILQPVTVSATMSIRNNCCRKLWLMVQVISDAVSDTAKAIKVSLETVDKILDFFRTTNVVTFPKRPTGISKHDIVNVTYENHIGGGILVSDEDVFRATELVLFSVKLLMVSVVCPPAAKSVVFMVKSSARK